MSTSGKHNRNTRVRRGLGLMFVISRQSPHSWGRTNMATRYGFQLPLNRHLCCYQNLRHIYLAELSAICDVPVCGRRNCGLHCQQASNANRWTLFAPRSSGNFSQRTTFGDNTLASQSHSNPTQTQATEKGRVLSKFRTIFNVIYRRVPRTHTLGQQTLKANCSFTSIRLYPQNFQLVPAADRIQ